MFYVVKSDSDISETTTLQLKRDSTNVNSQGYITGLDGRTDFYIYGGGGRSNYPVKYSVDGGMLYVGTDKSYAVTPTISKEKLDHQAKKHRVRTLKRCGWT